VIDNRVLGWILGPPGTGKSTTALAFASTLNRRDWVVTWIHLSRVSVPLCVRLEGDLKRSCKIKDFYIQELFEILNEVDNSKQHIVFIDGYALNGDNHNNVQKICNLWLENNLAKRRLVVVCSMSSRYKAKPEEDMLLNLEEFMVYSWKEQEYFDAVKNEEFFNNVKHVLDAHVSTDDSFATPEELVRTKLYYAGTSARWMFLFPTMTVMKQTDISLGSVSDILLYIKGQVGDQSNNVINRLFSLNQVKHCSYRRKVSIVSRYASCMLAIMAGPELIRNLAEAANFDGNPSMDGWMFEMWFFSSLRHSGVDLFDKNNRLFLTWDKSDVEILDMNSFPDLSEENGVWFKPNKWNQGGFDAVFLDKKSGLVKFVQVTCAKTHTFKTEYFRDFLLALPESFRFKRLEIFFVVDHNNRSSFRLANPSKTGILTKFGWNSGEEVQKVKIGFMKEWNNGNRGSKGNLKKRKLK
jgi:hypothetical protein